jgi:hypothetical protein
MDVISLIHESLQIVYSFIPQELLIIILAYFVMVILTYKGEKNSAKKNY